MLLQKKLLRTRNHLETSNIHVIRTGLLSVNTLIVFLGNKRAFVVDPAASKLSHDENKVIDYLHNKKIECVGIVLTHSHFDHILGIDVVKNAFPKAPVLIHEAEGDELINPPGRMNASVLQFFGMDDMKEVLGRQPQADILLKNNQTLECLGEGGEKWKVIHTPGHTPGSICLYNEIDGLLISGDTLFAEGGYGRTDMYGGDTLEIMHSLSMLKATIPEGTKVYPGHEDFGFSL